MNYKGLTVITGKNGSGKTRLIEKIKKENPEFLVLDTDSHCHLNNAELQKFAEDLKEKLKITPAVVASLRKEIANMADKIIRL